MESPRYDANFDIKQAAKDQDFPQFRSFPAEIQVLVFEQAVLTTAEELPDKYKFEFTVQGSDLNVVLVSPSPQLTRACEIVRSLMQTCRAALETVINVTGGKLRVGHKKVDENRQVIRYEYLPFDFEHSTFCIELIHKKMPFGPDVLGGKRALMVQPALRGLDFAPRLKNLSLIVSGACICDPKYRDDICKLIKFFPNLTKCTLVSEVYWSKTGGILQRGHDPERKRRAKDVFARNSFWGINFYKATSHYHHSLNKVQELTGSFVEFHSMCDQTTSMKNPASSVFGQLVDGLDELDKPAAKSHDVHEQTIQEPTTLDHVGFVEHALDWMDTKKFDDGRYLCWVSLTIHLQRTVEKDDSSALDGASYDALFLNQSKLPERSELRRRRLADDTKLSREEEALLGRFSPGLLLPYQ